MEHLDQLDEDDPEMAAAIIGEGVRKASPDMIAEINSDVIHNMNEQERIEWDEDEKHLAKYLGEMMVVEEIAENQEDFKE